MTWQLYTAICVVTLSVSILLQRVLMHRHKLNPVVFASLFQFIVALAVLPYALLHGLDFRGFQSVWPLVVLSAIGFGIGSNLYNRALQVIDASAFSVFFATHAVWVALVGIWFLHERLTVLHIAGIALVFFSVLVLVKNTAAFRFDRRLVLGLGTGLAYGIAIACSAYVSRKTDVPTWTIISFLAGGTASLMLAPKTAWQYSDILRSKALPTIVGLSVLYAVGNMTLSYAYRYGSLSLVSPLRQTGIILTTILAFAFMQDERTDIARKLTAALICTLGVILLVI